MHFNAQWIFLDRYVLYWLCLHPYRYLIIKTPMNPHEPPTVTMKQYIKQLEVGKRQLKGHKQSK